MWYVHTSITPCDDHPIDHHPLLFVFEVIEYFFYPKTLVTCNNNISCAVKRHVVYLISKSIILTVDWAVATPFVLIFLAFDATTMATVLCYTYGLKQGQTNIPKYGPVWLNEPWRWIGTPMPSIISQHVSRSWWRYRRRNTTRRPYERVRTGRIVVHRSHQGTVSTGEGILRRLVLLHL